MNDCIKQITKAIDWYKTNRNAPPEQLIQALVSITTNLYTLENYRAEYKHTFEKLVYTYVNENNSVARSINMADVEIPELYMLRRIMEAAYEVVGSLRTHISFLKQELNTINIQK